MIGAAGNLPALDGLKVIDLAPMMPGQFTTMILGDLGAEVVKIERPEVGDYARGALPGSFEAVNRNKRSITVDLKSPRGVDILHRLAADADVLVEGFRPGVAARLGAGYAELSSLCPELIYCSVSGFGQTGPRRDATGHDPDYLALAGVLSLAGDPDGPPTDRVGASMADLSGAFFATISVLAALQARHQTGRGQYIDVALADAAFSLLQSRLVEYLVNDRPDKATLMARPAIGVFACADGRHLTVAAVEDHFWRALCDVIGLGQWRDDPRFSTPNRRREQAANIRRTLAEAFLGAPRDDWLERLSAAGIPCSPVHNLEEALEDPHAVEREIVTWHEHPTLGTVPQVRFPALLASTPARVSRRPPLLGEHTVEILGELGFTPGEISQLRQERVI